MAVKEVSTHQPIYRSDEHYAAIYKTLRNGTQTQQDFGTILENADKIGVRREVLGIYNAFKPNGNSETDYRQKVNGWFEKLGGVEETLKVLRNLNYDYKKFEKVVDRL